MASLPYDPAGKQTIRSIDEKEMALSNAYTRDVMQASAAIEIYGMGCVALTNTMNQIFDCIFETARSGDSFLKV